MIIFRALFGAIGIGFGLFGIFKTCCVFIQIFGRTVPDAIAGDRRQWGSFNLKDAIIASGCVGLSLGILLNL